MILDTSALAAIFFGEPEVDLYTQVIHDAERCPISAANFVELSMVIESQSVPMPAASATYSSAGLRSSSSQSLLNTRTWLGKPSSISARVATPPKLNFGDCFAYALAKAAGEPLLFKGEDFSKTDIRAAL